MNLALFLGGIFLFTFFLGIFLERIRIPWIFASLILGLIFAFKNPFSEIVSSETFRFLAWLGMYFLLFLIGFELDLEKIKRLRRFIIKSTLFIIVFEAIFGTLLVHLIFNISWLISILIALSFATVGEAVLIPILDKFKLTKTKLGQSILGIGVLDDVIEVLVIIIAIFFLSFLFGRNDGGIIKDIQPVTSSLFLLFFLIFLIILFKRKFSKIKIKSIELISLFCLSVFFLFVGIGEIAEASALGALLAGIFIKNFFSKERIKKIEESEIKTLAYGFFGPLFFFWVGIDTNLGYLFKNIPLVLLVVGITYSSKVLGSFISAKKELGRKISLFLGINLCVRFSTSLVIIKFFFEKGLIGLDLYSILIATTTFSIIIPFFLPFLIQKWKIIKII